MSRIARGIARDLAENEAYVASVNAAFERLERRREIAAQIARETYGSDEVDILPSAWLVETQEPRIEEVDGGYWVEARVWVEIDDVEERMEP